MAAMPERLSTSSAPSISRMYAPELLPLLQSLLADLADLDFEHASDVETIGNSTAEEWLKQAAIRRLQDRHRERRTPYVRQLEAVQERVRTMAA
jgi:hypothetical protein